MKSMQVLIPAPLAYRKRQTEYTIWPLGDLHFGAAAVDEKKLKEDVEKIRADKHAVVIGMGDYLDCVVHSDARRFDPKALADWIPAQKLDNMVELQIERCVKVLAPIADRFVCMLSGNHEETIRKKYHFDPTEALARELGRVAGRRIPVLGKAGFVRLRFYRGTKQESSLSIVLHHGWFAGRKSGGKVNNLHDALSGFDADLLIVAHGHDPVVAPAISQLGVDQNGNIVDRMKRALMTGAYLRTYAQGVRGYGEDFGYRPTTLGAVPIVYQPETKGMRIIS